MQTLIMYELLFMCFIYLVVFLIGAEMEFSAWKSDVVEKLEIEFGPMNTWDARIVSLADFDAMYKFGLTVSEAAACVLESYLESIR